MDLRSCVCLVGDEPVPASTHADLLVHSTHFSKWDVIVQRHCTSFCANPQIFRMSHSCHLSPTEFGHEPTDVGLIPVEGFEQDKWSELDEASDGFFSLDLFVKNIKHNEKESTKRDDISGLALFSALPVFSIAKERESEEKQKDGTADSKQGNDSPAAAAKSNAGNHPIEEFAAYADGDDKFNADDDGKEREKSNADADTADEKDRPKADSGKSDDVQKPVDVAKPTTDASADVIKEASTILQGKENSLKVLESINKDLTDSKGILYGPRLERVRNNLRELIANEPALASVLEPLAKHLQIPQISGRSDAIQKRLDSTDPTIRSNETRVEIERLMDLKIRFPADLVELDRLRKAFLQDMKETRARWDKVVKDADLIYEKEQIEKKLSASDEAELTRLNQLSKELRQQNEAHVQFLVKMLNAEADATAFLTTRGGKGTEGIVFQAVKDRLESLQKSDVRWKNFEVVKLSGGAVDDLGGDFLLLDKKTGNYLLIDATQQDANGEKKGNLPPLRKAGLISSDPDLWEGRAAARRLDIQMQADVIFDRLKDGKMTLNIYAVDVPVARHTTSKLNYKERIDYIKSVANPTNRATEIRAFREELLEKRNRLRETLDMMRDQKQDLRGQKRGEKPDVRDRLDGKIGALDGLIDHTEEKPLYAIEKNLQELDRLTLGLPQDKQHIASVETRPGERYNAPGQAQPIKKLIEAVTEAKAVLGSTNPVAREQLVKALDTLLLVHSAQSTEADILRSLKARVLAPSGTPTDASKASASGTAGGGEKVAPTAPDRLAVPRALLSEDSIAQFHGRLELMAATLKDAPVDSGIRIQDAVSQFLADSGLKEPHLSKDKLEVTVSKEAMNIQVEYSAKGKPVSRINGNFVLTSDGKTPIAANEVESRFVVPEKLLKGNTTELSKALYVSLMEQTVHSSAATTAGDKAGIKEFVNKGMAKIIPTITETPVSSSSGVDFTRLPQPVQQVAALEISERGVKIGNVEREIGFVELWDERVKSLKDKLAQEEAKVEKERDQQRILALKAAINQEDKLLSDLRKGNGPEYADAVKRAQEIVKDFKPSVADIDRLANERGPGGVVRGKLVAVSTLLNAFIAYKSKGGF